MYASGHGNGARAPAGGRRGSVDGAGELQGLVLDQITKIQERQQRLDERLDKLAREQEEFYLNGYKKMDQGFKDVSKCLQEVRAMKEVFKEIIGVMTGERVRFVDHSNESCDAAEAQGVNQSELLVDNMRRQLQQRQSDWIRDRLALETRPGYGVKNEFEGERSVEQMLVQRQQELADVSDGRVPPDDFPTYRMNRAIRSVTDLAREYYEGLRGKPSVMSLERRFGSTWRNSSKERTFFHKRMCIINKINDIKDNPVKYQLPQDITRKMAIRVVENMRLGNNCFKGRRCCLTLSQLYVYLSKKMDTSSDYSLELRQVGKTTRELITQERIRSLEPPSRDSPMESPPDGIPGRPVMIAVSSAPASLPPFEFTPVVASSVEDSNDLEENGEEEDVDY
ncbi:AEL308Wp [Eremothecium gossypii ATCC 10895]|uniref:AEL308Wp n=1 Tax=Eremothecium gossypii (strain ATCC 10895 / CBS 109.51 / FGSC 9923 / NRRL Y-1056) TaxID=284811 RepID=Q758R1_EREGS|nr:AEL308Wp [Eremothecium gossypii ATCC 10895]AAS52376.1 AEL308Wp [Eremothecium gossypii ATCC 10895]AEY96673.1 FAEL308Wp [Eremothecium gossypii FDAG1]